MGMRWLSGDMRNPVALTGVLPSLTMNRDNPVCPKARKAMSKWMAVLVAVLTAVGALVPAVAWAYGQKAGPCTVSVRCTDGSTVSCYGARVCYWRVDSPAGTGFVECDSGGRITCELLLDEEGEPILEAL
jgi:hypothetical protein